jgi:hypothetical protein
MRGENRMHYLRPLQSFFRLGLLRALWLVAAGARQTLAQAPGRARPPTRSPRPGRLRDGPRTQAMCFMASCALPTASSPRSTFPTQAQAAAKARRSKASTQRGRPPEITSTRTVSTTALCDPRVASSPRLRLRARARNRAKAPAVGTSTQLGKFAGAYSDANSVVYNFLRAPDGAFAQVNCSECVPGVGTGPGQA